MSDDGSPPRPPRKPSTDAQPLARMTPAGGIPRATGAAPPRATPSGGTPRTTPGAGTPRTTPGGGIPRTTSKEMRALSAARTQPARPSAQRAPEGKWHTRALARATDLTLNAWSILKEAYEGFRRSDAYFKYRVLVVVTWGVLSLAGMGVACPGHGGSGNALDARLVMTVVNDQAVYLIVNESDEAWKDVRVVVNDRYSAAVTRVNPGADVTVGIKKLMDETGKPAPANLRVETLVIRTDDDEVELMKAGVASQ